MIIDPVTKEEVPEPICPLNMFFEGDEDKCDASCCDYGEESRSCTKACRIDNKKLQKQIEETQEKSVYDLKLHESTTAGPWLSIVRVPGGWIYEVLCVLDENVSFGVFVPYSDEFKIKSEERQEDG